MLTRGLIYDFLLVFHVVLCKCWLSACIPSGLLTWSRPREARPETRAWIEHADVQRMRYEVPNAFAKAAIVNLLAG